jgi:hypothetical protein
MTLILNIKSEIAAGLAAQAQAAGLSLEDFLQRVMEERTEVPRTRLSGEEWFRRFEEWADGFSEAPPIPDEVLTRKNLYPDRW